MAVEQEFVTLETLLEGRAHEAIAGSGELQNLEVDPEEGEVDHKRPNNEAKGTSCEVAVEMFLKRCQ